MEAVQWLQRFRSDDAGMKVMRTILSQDVPSLPLHRMLRHDVIEQFAQLLERRVWHVHEPPFPKARQRVEPEIGPDEPVPSGGDTPIPSGGDDGGGDSLLNDLDEAAIAAALKLAALLGIPLCEECTRG